MAPPVCEISFDDNSDGVFRAGQRLSGQIDITVPTPKKVKGIQLKITGLACVKWSESDGSGHTSVFYGRKDYLSHVVDLVQSETEEIIELNVGQHVYKFSHVLPDSLPTSFEGDFGYIRYTVKILFLRPWKFDLTYKIAFTVVNQLNLNAVVPPLNVAVAQEHMKLFSCGPCRSAPLLITVLLPMTGYVPGQLILTSVDIVNRSRKHVSEVKIKLRRQVQYLSTVPLESSKNVCCTLVKYQCAGVDGNGTAGYERRLLVPRETPTQSTGLIHIGYFIEVVAKVPGLYQNPRVRIPITIGTVPLLNLNKSQERSSSVVDGLLLSAVPTHGHINAGFRGSLQSLKLPPYTIPDDEESPGQRSSVYRFDRQQQPPERPLSDSDLGTAGAKPENVADRPQAEAT